MKEGINYNPGDPNYDLFKPGHAAARAKRLFPNFSFQDAPFNLQYYKPGHPETEIAYMGCRTRVIGNVYDPDQRDLQRPRQPELHLHQPAPTGHQGQSQHRRRFFDESGPDDGPGVWISCWSASKSSARKRVRNYPFLMGQGVWLDSEKLGWDDEVREVLKHGTLSVGFIGLAETLKALVGAAPWRKRDGPEPGPGDHRPHAPAAATKSARKPA